MTEETPRTNLVPPRPTGPFAQARATWRGWPRPAKVTAALAFGLVLVVVAALVGGVVVARRPLPQTTGTLTLPGLGSTVEVVRDQQGVPQVYADTTEDLILAQGYVTASERFFQMDVRRHVAAGRLAELFGARAVDSDTLARTLGWERTARAELALVEPETRTALAAYADGVNAYLDQHGPSDLAVEYTLLDLGGLDYQPEPWSEVDSLAWLKTVAWELGGNLDQEVDRALTAGVTGRRGVAELFPATDDVAAPIVDQGAVVDGVYQQDADRGATRNPRRPGWLADQTPECAAGRDRPGARHRRRAGRPADLGRPGLRTRLQRLGRRRGPHGERGPAPGQRPPPRRRRPRGVDAGRPALPHGLELVPLRRRRLQPAGRARGGHRPQRGRRLGHGQPRGRRHRPLRGAPRRGLLRLRRRAGPAAHPPGDHRGRRRPRRHPRGPLDPSRTAALRRVPALRPAGHPHPARRPRPALTRGPTADLRAVGAVGGPAPQHHRGRRPRPGPRRGLGRLPRRAVVLRPAGPGRGLRRHRRPCRVPGRGTRAGAQVGQRRLAAGRRLALGDRLDRGPGALRRPAERARPAERDGGGREPGGGRRGLPVTR